jgi:hypothetical protein
MGPYKNTFASWFRPSIKKSAVPKISIEHIKIKLFILVLNDENHMKIAKIRMNIALKSKYRRIKIFNKKKTIHPVPSFLGAYETGSKSNFISGLD